MSEVCVRNFIFIIIHEKITFLTIKVNGKNVCVVRVILTRRKKNSEHYGQTDNEN